MGPRIPVSIEREIGSWEARYRDAALQDGDFCQRMLLARTRLWKIAYAEKQHRLLGSENRPQPQSRRGELPAAAGEWMARDSHLGVPTDAQIHRAHHARGGTAAERKHAVTLQKAHTRPIQHRGRRAVADGSGRINGIEIATPSERPRKGLFLFDMGAINIVFLRYL